MQMYCIYHVFTKFLDSATVCVHRIELLGIYRLECISTLENASGAMLSGFIKVLLIFGGIKIAFPEQKGVQLIELIEMCLKRT